MIKAIIKGIMSLIISLVSVILAPIDALISQFLPSLSSALSGFSSFLTMCGQYIGWVIDFTGLSSETISLIIAYFVFKLTVPLLVSSVKVAIKWYNALKV